MLFLLALPVISCVALLGRHLQIYGPTNMLIRHFRSAPPRWRTVSALAALAAALLIAMHAVAVAVEHGAPGWLNLFVIVLAWDAIKVFGGAITVAAGRSVAIVRSVVRASRRLSAD